MLKGLGIGGIAFQSNEPKQVKQQKTIAIYKWRTPELKWGQSPFDFSFAVESLGDCWYTKQWTSPFPTWRVGMMVLTSSVCTADKIRFCLKLFALGMLQEYSRNNDKTRKRIGATRIIGTGTKQNNGEELNLSKVFLLKTGKSHQ